MFKKVLLAILLLLTLAYAVIALVLATSREPAPEALVDGATYPVIAIFGASGTAGDGILKAALADAAIEKIYVVTRRTTPRIEAGVAAGKVEMALHMDYTDYSAVIDQLADSDAVYWALGTSSIGVDEATYIKIHVDFPLRFVEDWSSAGTKSHASFHYISSSDISAQSTSMWARQKYRAEQLLFAYGREHGLEVIAYRPDYIGPTGEEAHFGQQLLFWFFRPVGAAVRATQIGQAMLEVTARASQFETGDKLNTSKIIQYSGAYEDRL